MLIRLKLFLSIVPLLFFFAWFLFDDGDEQYNTKDQNTNLSLSLQSVGVSTMSLNITPEDSLVPFTFELTQNDSTVQMFLLQSDTLLKETGLEPNTRYTYQGYWRSGENRYGESDTLTVTTLDTTSHNFSWEVISLHTASLAQTNEWYDVDIIDENNIWVVGMVDTDTAHYKV